MSPKRLTIHRKTRSRTARGLGRIPFGASVAAIASLWAMNWDSYLGIRPGPVDGPEHRPMTRTTSPRSSDSHRGTRLYQAAARIEPAEEFSAPLISYPRYVVSTSFKMRPDDAIKVNILTVVERWKSRNG